MNARRQNYPSVEAPRAKGSAPESFVATMGHHVAQVSVEKAAPSADVRSGEAIAPEHGKEPGHVAPGLDADGELIDSIPIGPQGAPNYVLAVHVIRSAGHAPAVRFSCTGRGMRTPWFVFMRSHSVDALSLAMRKAFAKLERKGGAK
jgi:hypothetical protein